MASIGRLDDKVALVTGASSGIGAGTAILFSQLGARVIITGRNEENLKKTAEQCSQDSKYKPVLLIGDLSKEEDTQRIVDEAIAAAGRLDILVNSAGILESGSIETTSLEQFDRIFNINVRSIYHLTMLCVPHLVKTKGNIVNVSSVTGLRAFPGVLSYCMSKSAIDQMTRCVALELAPKQVRVNCVNPGVIVTEVHKRGGMSEEKYAQFLEHCKTTHALGRAGEVSEVAKLIAFLASDSASFMTGNTVAVDGGRHAMCPR
ncbi:3-oxoacyl-[acyl-carrier-protein] reductase FabG-like [Haliotis rufescens]|uniref:3-oxoacyl-[acyl-carrier-protein] reductase FabG-like n=1 Tax=Haliotis rufescens TaxID=6454 RepID=UPI00201ECCB3|nr:3-oxoacyl-[acyl-carrier-protein] reductase FabG-like [Haliotis rufescens]